MQNPLLDRLTETRLANERCRTAHALAKARAAESEIARFEAESRHANVLADCLMSGSELPKKPAQLSAIQATDDCADSALAIIEKRASAAEGEMTAAAWALLEASITALAVERAGAAREALTALISPFQKLIATLGKPLAIAAVAELTNLPWRDDSLLAVGEIATLIPEAANPRALWEIRAAELHTIPTPSEIRALCESRLAEAV